MKNEMSKRPYLAPLRVVLSLALLPLFGGCASSDASPADDDLHGSGVQSVSLSEKPSMALWSSHWKGGKCIATYIGPNTAITTRSCARQIESWGKSTNMTLMSFGASTKKKPERTRTIVEMKHHPDGEFSLLYTKDSAKPLVATVGSIPSAGKLSLYSLREQETLKGAWEGDDYEYSAERLDFVPSEIPTLATSSVENGAPVFIKGTNTLVALIISRDSWWDSHVSLAPAKAWIAANLR